MSKWIKFTTNYSSLTQYEEVKDEWSLEDFEEFYRDMNVGDYVEESEFVEVPPKEYLDRHLKILESSVKLYNDRIKELKKLMKECY